MNVPLSLYRKCDRRTHTACTLTLVVKIVPHQFWTRSSGGPLVRRVLP